MARLVQLLDLLDEFFEAPWMLEQQSGLQNHGHALHMFKELLKVRLWDEKEGDSSAVAARSRLVFGLLECHSSLVDVVDRFAADSIPESLRFRVAVHPDLQGIFEPSLRRVRVALLARSTEHVKLEPEASAGHSWPCGSEMACLEDEGSCHGGKRVTSLRGR